MSFRHNLLHAAGFYIVFDSYYRFRYCCVRLIIQSKIAWEKENGTEAETLVFLIIKDPEWRSTVNSPGQTKI